MSQEHKAEDMTRERKKLLSLFYRLLEDSPTREQDWNANLGSTVGTAKFLAEITKTESGSFESYAITNVSDYLNFLGKGGDFDRLEIFMISILSTRSSGRKWLIKHDPCVYCGEKAETRDHIIPRSIGGVADYGNSAPACKSCNSRKGDMSLLEFLLWRKDRSVDKDATDG